MQALHRVGMTLARGETENVDCAIDTAILAVALTVRSQWMSRGRAMILCTEFAFAQNMCTL